MLQLDPLNLDFSQVSEIYSSPSFHLTREFIYFRLHHNTNRTLLNKLVLPKSENGLKLTMVSALSQDMAIQQICTNQRPQKWSKDSKSFSAQLICTELKQIRLKTPCSWSSLAEKMPKPSRCSMTFTSSRYRKSIFEYFPLKFFLRIKHEIFPSC